jgi:hypothetical protein
MPNIQKGAVNQYNCVGVPKRLQEQPFELTLAPKVRLYAPVFPSQANHPSNREDEILNKSCAILIRILKF